MALIYRAEPRTIVKAFTGTAVAAMVHMFPLYWAEIEEKIKNDVDDFNTIYTADQDTAKEFAAEVVPKIASGDTSGDYSAAVGALDRLISDLQYQRTRIVALKDRSAFSCSELRQTACAELDQVLQTRTELYDGVVREYPRLTSCAVPERPTGDQQENGRDRKSPPRRD